MPTIHPAGAGWATELPDMDFETYSEAGYFFNDASGRWKKVQANAKSGLHAVGAPVYSEHPSTEVLCLAYNLKDGRGPRLWKPGDPPPTDLFDHIAAGGVIEAHNSAFEYLIWNNVCVTRMGWPPLPLDQTRDSAAKARAFGLPGGLGVAAAALGVADQKIGDGERLINKFSIPHTPTKKDPRHRIPADPDDPDAKLLYEYCLGDIAAETAVSTSCPDLSPHELQVWKTDQRINQRGVQVDTDAVANFQVIVDDALAQAGPELERLTGGDVDKPTQIQRIVKWLAGEGLHTSSLDADAVSALLARGDLPWHVRRVLEIREAVGSASVKKLQAISRSVSRDGRLRDMFAYCGAERTGRWAGYGPQPHNLPNHGPSVNRCTCGRHCGTTVPRCPWCGVPTEGATVVEWSLEAVEDAIETARHRSRHVFEWVWGNSLPTILGCLRGLFVAAPGHDLICSDYSAIEAVVLAALAGEQWRLDVFSTHGKIYEMSASKITGIPFEEFLAHKEQTGEHHPLRKKIGKVAELACFGPDTRLLTNRGYVNIEEVSTDDLLWDGVEWVTHDGVVPKGKRQVLNLDGVTITPDHPVSLNDSWKAAKQLVSNPRTLRLALANGSRNLPWSNRRNKKTRTERLFNAPAGAPRTSQRCLTWLKVRRPDVESAAVKKPAKRTSNSTQNTPMSVQTQSIADVLLTVFGRPSPDVTAGRLKGTRITGDAGSQFATNGAAKAGPVLSSPTLCNSTGGITRILKWIASTLTSATNQATSDFALALRTLKISGRSTNFRRKSITYANVYDVINAGPRNRFTIKTDSGHLIVHNSGYRGWVGAWKAFGADDYFETDEDIEDAIRKWRAGSPAVCKLWYQLEDAAIAAVDNPGRLYTYRMITYGAKQNVLYCRLPSGRMLAYHDPRIIVAEHYGEAKRQLTFMGWDSQLKKWLRIRTHGGKLTENADQAASRDIFAAAMVRLEAHGYRPVLHTHDEFIVEVPKGFGSIEEMEALMTVREDWFADWPIRAAGGWRGHRYRKD